MYRAHALTWLCLIALTLFSFDFRMLMPEGAWMARTGGVVILLIALLKVRLVARQFMEIREAGKSLRIALDIWLVALASALVLASGS